MLNVPVELAGVRRLRSEIAALQAELEACISRLAEVLPRSGAELGELNSALASCAADSSESSLLPRLLSLRGTGRDLLVAVGITMGADRDVAGRSEALRHSTETVAKGFARIVDLSVTLKLVALNASAAAARAGAKAAGFAVLTRELGTVARKTTDAVPKMRGNAAAIHELSAEVLATQSDLHFKINEFAKQSQTMGQAIETSIATLNKLRSSLESFRARSASNVKPIGTIMVAVQRQDIVRQKLDHVLLALDELVSVFARADDARSGVSDDGLLRFQSRIGRLCASLLTDIGKDLEELLDELASGLAMLDAASLAFSSLREVVPDGPAMRAGMTAPAAVVQEVQNSFRPISDLIASQGTVADRVTSFAVRLQNQLNAFGGLNVLLSTINVLVKIEVSRTASLTSQVTLTNDIGKLQQEYLTIMRNAADELPEVVRSALALSEASSRLRDQRKRLGEIEAEVSSAVEGLHGAGSAFVDAFERAMEIAGNLVEHAGHFRRSVDALRRSSSRRNEAAEALNDMARRAEQAMGGAPDAKDSSYDELEGRLQDVIARFTVVSHKEAAKDIAGVATSAADAPGTLTLF